MLAVRKGNRPPSSGHGARPSRRVARDNHGFQRRILGAGTLSAPHRRCGHRPAPEGVAALAAVLAVPPERPGPAGRGRRSLADGAAPTACAHLRTYSGRPEARRAIQVATVEESKAQILAVLQNEQGPALNIVLLNAGAAIYVAGRAKSISEGIAHARRVITSGEAKAKLDEFVAATNQFKAKG